MKRMLVFLCVLLIVSYYTAAQNVGIGTTNPTAKLHTVGSIRFDTLSGTGIRPVFADASGNLLATISETTLPITSVTNSTSQGIPDNSCTGITSNIVLSGLPGSVPSIYMKVTLNITHTFMGDLSIYLVAPDGSVLNLWKWNGGGSDNLVNTSFAETGTPISLGTSPYTGSFIPAGDLAVACSITPTVTSFGAIGGGTINPNGTWILKIFDQALTDIGSLVNWTISVDPNIGGREGVWGLRGNTGNNIFNFIGTTDNVPLNFRVNNEKAGSIGSGHTFFGVQSGKANTSGYENSAFGGLSLTSNTTGSDNSANGHKALFSNTTGWSNTATGHSALLSNTSGDGNTATGNYCLSSNTTGYWNSAHGYDGLSLNTTGKFNTANGAFTLYNNTTASENTAVGYATMYSNTTGDTNTAVGSIALYYNTTGRHNTAVGRAALFHNTSGVFNTAVGSEVMLSNTTGDANTSVGYHSLISNTTGNFNTACGDESMSNNSTGWDNTAQGQGSLYHNTTGSSNTAIGENAAFNNTSGFWNTSVGSLALSNIATGTSNSAFGYGAGWTLTAGSNNTMIGYYAEVPNATGSNQVRIGNSAVSYAGVQVAWTITSDSRYKSQIRNSDLGLNFINRLRPVSYFRNNDKSEKSEYGFIAQEVEQALQQSGSANTGIISKDDAGMYSMRYNDLMAPMVKAIQEQQAMIDDLKKEIEELKKMFNRK